MDFAVNQTTSTLDPVGLWCADLNDVQAGQGSSSSTPIRWDQRGSEMSTRCGRDDAAAYGLQVATGGAGGVTGVNMLCRSTINGRVTDGTGPVRVSGTADSFGRLYTVDRDSDTAALGGVPAAIDGLAVTGSDPVTGLRATSSYGGTSTQLVNQFIPPPIQNAPLDQRMKHDFTVRFPALLNSVAQQATDTNPAFAMAVTALVLVLLIIAVAFGPKIVAALK